MLDVFGEYFFWKSCRVVLSGDTSNGVCTGAEPCAPGTFPPGYECRIGSCGDQPIDPVPLCCQRANGSCDATIATTAGAVGAISCGSISPPEEGDVDRLMVGTCGGDGRCVPAN